MNQYSAQDSETLNSLVKLNGSLKQFCGITKPLSHFFLFFTFHSFYFKAKSDLNCNYKIEINHGFVENINVCSQGCDFFIAFGIFSHE